MAMCSADAVKKLMELLSDESKSIQLSASDKLLTHAIKYREVDELRAQLANLLAQLDQADAERRKPQ